MATPRIKNQALTAAVPQSKEACAALIRELGDLQREFERQRADMNDAIAAITAQHQPVLETFGELIRQRQAGIQAWCESHRTELLGEGPRAGKTANLVTGEVSWRQRPPKVNVRDADTVLETLARMGLQRFIREVPEVNKQAILAEPDAVRGIAGITVVTGLEDFVIQPFEVAAEMAGGVAA